MINIQILVIGATCIKKGSMYVYFSLKPLLSKRKIKFICKTAIIPIIFTVIEKVLKDFCRIKYFNFEKLIKLVNFVL